MMALTVQRIPTLWVVGESFCVGPTDCALWSAEISGQLPDENSGEDDCRGVGDCRQEKTERAAVH